MIEDGAKAQRSDALCLLAIVGAWGVVLAYIAGIVAMLPVLLAVWVLIVALALRSRRLNALSRTEKGA